MKKAYIQPEIELLSVASLENFLDLSPTEGANEGFTDNGKADGDDWDDWN